jgi:hypothetical protein
MSYVDDEAYYFDEEMARDYIRAKNKQIKQIKQTNMKTNKIINVQSEGTWDSPNGLMYKWEVEFENGDHGQAMTKDKEHKTWTVGSTVNYTLTPNANPKYLGKLTLIKDAPQVNGVAQPYNTGFTPVDNDLKQRMIIAQSSLSSAVEFYKNRTMSDTNDVLETAKVFYKWVINTSK